MNKNMEGRTKHAVNHNTKRRLKDSCNSCGLTKVKCNKAKPKCSRCEERGIACHYSPSQRSGRRAAASIASTLPMTKPVLLPNDKPRIREQQASFPLKAPKSDFSKMNTSCEIDNAASDDVSSQESDEPTIDMMAAEELIFDSTLVSPGNLDGLDATNFDFFGSGFREAGLSSGSSCDDLLPFLGEWKGNQSIAPLTPLSMNEPGQNMFFESKSGLLDRTHSCLTLALNILPMLHIPPPTCTASSIPANQSLYPTFDYVISTNKAIIEIISNMLSCSCSLDEQLASILSLIAFKLMAWYSAAAKEVDEESCSDLKFDSSERVLQLPLTVGKYKLDGLDASWMRAQLILSELQRMIRLVGLLSKRFEEVQSQSAVSTVVNCGTSGARSCWISSSIFSQLETDLKKRLHAVTEETTTILKCCQSRS